VESAAGAESGHGVGMSFHTEALMPPMEQAIDVLAPALSDSSFLLGGGTAVALYLGHRRSVDLVWFTAGPFEDPRAFAGSLQETGVDFEVERIARGTLHGHLLGVRVSLLRFSYPLLDDPVPWPAVGCSLLSLDDLACMKLSAIAQRGARKDFLDLYAIVRKHRPLSELLPLYSKKFQTADIAHVLYGLSYFEDAESEPMPEMLWTEDWDQIKDKVQAWVRDLGSS